jgi:hypothetical protein
VSDPCVSPGLKIRDELRFSGLPRQRRGYAFPCDEAGLVDLDKLSDRNRPDHFFARTVVGKKLSAPVVTQASTELPELRTDVWDSRRHVAANIG